MPIKLDARGVLDYIISVWSQSEVKLFETEKGNLEVLISLQPSSTKLIPLEEYNRGFKLFSFMIQQSTFVSI